MLDLIGLAGGDGFADDIQQTGRSQAGGNMRAGRKLAESTFGRTVLKQHAGILVEDEDRRIQHCKAGPDTGNDTFGGHLGFIRFRNRGFIGFGRHWPFPNRKNGDDGAEPKNGRHIGRVQFRNGHDGQHADDENGQPVSAKLSSQKP